MKPESNLTHAQTPLHCFFRCNLSTPSRNAFICLLLCTTHHYKTNPIQTFWSSLMRPLGANDCFITSITRVPFVTFLAEITRHGERGNEPKAGLDPGSDGKLGQPTRGRERDGLGRRGDRSLIARLAGEPSARRRRSS
jgi:hypothetical protein